MYDIYNLLITIFHAMVENQGVLFCLWGYLVVRFAQRKFFDWMLKDAAQRAESDEV